jgi:alkyl sulfatase BDS1-like metallo-beta-lactamase superfamily hydrolase|tara:strand:- start:9 stop:644 length:636 start_codon:yes stop_codon:yes gene_type:complete
MMGGAVAIMSRSEELVEDGRYRMAMELLNKLVYAEQNNQVAKDLLADVFEQLGYQYESASMRNVFLATAQDLRNGMPRIPAPRGTSPSLARAMTTSQWWDAEATRVDSDLADGNDFIINFLTPDTDESYVVEMSSGTLTNIGGYSSDNADATITMNRSDLDTVIMGAATLGSLLQTGVGSVEGDVSVLLSLTEVLVEFAPGFETMPGTAPK